MLGWSIKLFRIRGIQLSLHGSFLLLLAYAAWAGWQEERGPGALGEVALVMAFFTCIVLHELGHAFAGRRFGVDVTRILLLPIGGMAEFTAIPRRPLHEVLMALAGPAVNFVIVGLLLTVVRFPPHWIDNAPAIPLTVGELGRHLVAANLVMGLFNLVPVFPMDGGRVLRALLASRFSYLRATFAAATLAKVLAVLAIAVALAAPQLQLAPEPLYLPAVLFAFIFFAGEMEYRMVRRTELEAAHWRHWWNRQEITSLPPVSAEPPC